MSAIAPQLNQALTGLDAFEAFCQAVGITEGTEFLCAYGEENKLTLKARKLEKGLVAWQVYKKNNYQGRGFGKLYRYEDLRELAKIQNLFFIPNLTTKGRSNACVDTPARYLYAEIDDLAIAEQRQKWGDFYQRSGLKPLAQVHTGNKSDHHYIGVEPDSIEEWGYLQKWLCALMDADPAPTSPHQPMRMAGFPRIKNDTEREVSLLESNPATYYTSEEIRAAFEKAWPYSEPFSLERWEKYRSAVAIATNPNIDNSRMAPMSEPADAFRLSDGELFPKGKTKAKNRQKGESTATYTSGQKSDGGFLDELINPLLDLPLESQYSLGNYDHQFQAKAPGLVGCSPWSPTNESGESFKVFTSNGGWFCHASQQGGGLLQYLQLQWIGKLWGEMEPDERKTFVRKLEKNSYWTAFANQSGIELDYSQSESHWRSQIESALAAQQMLSGPVEVGTFPELEIGPNPQLFVLDGQKGTRKTSKSIKSLIADCKKKGLRAVVFSPTRLLNKSEKRTLGLPTIDEVKLSQRDKVPFVIACPESAHKLSLLDFDLVIIDEANEVVERILEGNLGNQPANSRRQFKRLLNAAKTVAIANDMLYKSTLNYVQRVGRFSADEVTVIRRRRPQTKMKINLYVDNGASAERWDGTDSDQPKQNTAFLDWTHNLMRSFSDKYESVSIPCGSQKRARELDRLLSPHAGPWSNVRCIDGQYTPKPVKEALAADPDGWLKRERIGAMIFTPTFNSGVSFESDHFRRQFECQTAFETASAASQRGERVRDAIWGKRIRERHIYTSRRGLAKYPDTGIFFPEYWAKFLKADLAERSHKIEEETASTLGAAEIFKGVRDIKLDDFSDIQELPEFLAIRAREIHFKIEALSREWTSNGWEICSGCFATEDERDEIRKRYQRVQQGIIEQKSRIGAKAKPAAVWQGVEPEGPIHAAKIHKAQLFDKLGGFKRLWEAKWLEAWDVASGNKSLDQIQLRALLQTAQTAPDEFDELRRFGVLRLIAKSADLEASTEARLPIPRRQLETAVLLSQCPEFLDIAFGRVAEWDKKSSHVTAIAAFMRSHAREFATLTSHNQRIHGLQFTEKTPDIKCVNKALKLLGLEPACLRREGEKRISIYGFKSTEQKLEALLEELDKRQMQEKPTWEVNRKITRAETEDELCEQFRSHLMATVADLQPQWKGFSERVLAELKIATKNPDTTSVKSKSSLTEVVSPQTDSLIGRWVKVGTSLSKWLVEAVERGQAIITQSNIYGLQRRVVDLSQISVWEGAIA
ncbi:MAG: hypothetical protein ACTS2F_27580 [Thainema sp.]